VWTFAENIETGRDKKRRCGCEVDPISQFILDFLDSLKEKEEKEWKRYITSLRESNRRLRALKEELTNAGL